MDEAEHPEETEQAEGAATDRTNQLLEELAQTAPILLQSIERLSGESGNQFVSLAKQAKSNQRLIVRQRRVSWVLAASVALDVALSAFLGYVYNQVHDVTHRLDAAQTTQRQKALCPLYGLFIASENPKARAVYPQGPAAYDRAFGIIRQGYDALNCTSFIAPTPTPKATP